MFNKCPEGIFTKISVSGGYFDYLLFCGGVCLFTGIAQIYEFLMCIRKYGSTFYIGIAMVVLPYFGPWEN